MNFKFLAGCVAAIAFIGGCDSSDNALNVSDIRPESSRPASSIEVNVFDDFIAAARSAPHAPVADSANLFSNAGFENGVNDWLECQPGAISASSDAYEGNGSLAIANNNCVYRSTTVIPGQSYTLSCFIKLTTTKAWSGMGMIFADSDFNSLLHAPVAVATSGKYMRLDTVGTAPADTSMLSMWIHSDHGAVVDNCSLTLVQNQSPRPTATEENLLSNGDFSTVRANGSADDWSAGCNGSVVSDGAGLFLSDGACVDQALSSAAINGVQSSESTFSCLVVDVAGYSDLSIFLDNSLAAVQTISPSDKNKRVEVKTNVVSPGNGFVSLYSEGHLDVEDCKLVSDGSTAGTNTDTDTDTGTDTNTATSARYRLTFNATWSAQTHPLNFPPPAHFSGLVGAVHNSDVVFWATGQLATDGIELMAETGDGSGVLSEVATAIANGSAASAIEGGNVPVSPGSVSIELEVTRDHPLVTVTTMVAPSPDWFVGIRDLSLFDGTDFIDSIVRDAVVYDSGTDSAERFTADDLDTQPPAVITRLTTPSTDTDFQNGLPSVGQFIIQKLP